MRTTANKMRPLTEDESKTVFEKLANYIVCRFYLPSLLILMLLAP
jgi:hypothetical protein